MVNEVQVAVVRAMMFADSGFSLEGHNGWCTVCNMCADCACFCEYL